MHLLSFMFIAVSIPPLCRYKVAPCVCSIFWGNELITYHKDSGDTHFFSGIEADVIKYCLSVKSFSIDELSFCSSRFENCQQMNIFLEKLICSLIDIDFLI